MAPCLLGYQEVALRLVKEGKKNDNIYWEWVESYSGKVYGEAVIRGRELLEGLSQDVGVKRISELVEIFAKATKVSAPPPQDTSLRGGLTRRSSDGEELLANGT